MTSVFDDRKDQGGFPFGVKQPALWLALIFSILYPGVNLLYQGRMRLGWWILAGSIISGLLATAAVSFIRLSTPQSLIVPALIFLLSILLWIVSFWLSIKVRTAPVSPKRFSWPKSIGVIVLLLLVGLGTKIAFDFPFSYIELNRSFHVPSASMQPTLGIGHRFFAQRVQAWELERRDLVVFSNKVGKTWVKRLVALPGDTISFANHEISVNGEPEVWSGPFGQQQACWRQRCNAVMLTRRNDIPRQQFQPQNLVLGPDQFFMLGDHRDNSADSRHPSLGTVSAAQIDRRATLGFWPLMPRILK